MKKLARVIQSIGVFIFLVSMCADSDDLHCQVLIGAAIILGVFIICAGIFVERSWVFEEEGDYEFDSHVDDNDDDIIYIIYDSSGNERYVDSK